MSRQPTPAEIRETNRNVTKKCDSCSVVMVADEFFGTFDNSLTFQINGGYSEYVDSGFIGHEELEFVLCHKCAHKMMSKFFPQWSFSHWHPKTEDKYCDGWTFEGQFEEHLGD